MPSSTTAILPMFHAASVFMSQLLGWRRMIVVAKVTLQPEAQGKQGSSAEEQVHPPQLRRVHDDKLKVKRIDVDDQNVRP